MTIFKHLHPGNKDLSSDSAYCPVIGGRAHLLPEKSQSEKFVESIYAFSIFMLLVTAITALYVTDIMITTYLWSFAARIVLLFKMSFSAIFLMSLALGYAQTRYLRLGERRRALAKLMRMVMLVFLLLALSTYALWHPSYREPIEVALFVLLTLVEVFVLEVHNMAFSVPPSSDTG